MFSVDIRFNDILFFNITQSVMIFFNLNETVQHILQSELTLTLDGFI